MGPGVRAQATPAECGRHRTPAGPGSRCNLSSLAGKLQRIIAKAVGGGWGGGRTAGGDSLNSVLY